MNKGLVQLLICYLLWGGLSIYWHALNTVNAIDILFYRIIFSFLSMLILLVGTGQLKLVWRETKQLFHQPKALLKIFSAAVLITINWGTYIYSVNHGRATEVSLGYYIMPLLSVLLAVIFLREHLSKNTLIALGFSMVGVSFLTIMQGGLPFPVILMALAFAFYGLIKKGLTISTVTAMTLESAIMVPVAIIYFILSKHQILWQYPPHIIILTVLSGLITIIPLILYAEALKHLKLSTVGLLQYLNPTIQLFIAIFILKETYSVTKLVAFSFIWIGVFVFCIGQWHAYRIQNKSIN
ncbi:MULTISPECIES: EamA family transporter RarD [unclassified Enterococcus]|uniref:EamA family transporter RarD n=1 Tax=unclassified Enterococcus TaxID=2608891 RepID=UPI001556043B|nr:MULTISPECIES: EamA family transporter RarD [unclassified Enterococcus]MBS7576799.1 EamA family transporter RarD [Enterococcus sp. MMGLQ5-2]MBS7584206.1 EamA family transporter RarD [Enterococcus sp. MMGLQ5-1]NPD12062.1 EamA family transporter RarD [Enterococcus sp. MMGLQ5-1]NPD36634.1 EamA family transporter RarD [Enterococcus sp. MMGLQ5-2]